MTRNFVRFDHQLAGQRPGQPEKPPSIPVEDLRDSSFTGHAVSSVSTVTKEKTAHFALDNLVAEQLGIEKMEKDKAEARIKAEIERRWQITKEKAEVEGYTAGLEQGKNMAYQAELPRIQEKVQKLDDFLQECDKLREKIFAANETFLMDIIAQVARMIVLKEVEVDQDYVRRVVLALLNQLGTKEDIKIYISEPDMKNIESLKQSIEKEFGKLSNTVIEQHPDVNVGGCKIETRFGVVDANLQVQIENVMKALKN